MHFTKISLIIIIIITIVISISFLLLFHSEIYNDYFGPNPLILDSIL